SRRERWLRWGVQVLRQGLFRWVRTWGSTVRRGLLRPPVIFQETYSIVDHSQVTLYTRRHDLFPAYRQRRSLWESPHRRVRVALITTVKNERESVDAWFQSLLQQTRWPEEVFIVDAGSTDGTLERLQTLASQAPFPCHVLVEPGVNIARGRNQAIRQARSEVIAVTDLGCRLRPDWLECLVGPFERDAGLQVVAGWYEAVDRRGRPFRRRRWPTFRDVWPQNFIPSSRSLAFTKAAWEAVGGYPEWLTLTGEDTYFASELKRYCPRWAFVPEAVVEWYAPDRLWAFWKKIYAWSVGDGESGVLAHTYWHSLVRVVLGGLTSWTVVGLIGAGILRTLEGQGTWLIAAGTGLGILLIGTAGRYARSLSGILWEAGAEVARVLGFLKGARRRPIVEARRASMSRGLFFMLSGVPIDDTGGGARCTQITLELLRQGYEVIFIYRFPRYESVDLNLKIQHPHLRTYDFRDFSMDEFLKASGPWIGQKPMAAIVEFPVEEFVPLIEQLKLHGATVIYDLLDDWNTALGSTWYKPAIERRIIQQSDILVATAPLLQERLRQWSGGRPVTLVPNAVNTRLFDRRRSYVRPDDMPRGEWTIIYIGALWGSWFDWDLLQAVARAYPEAAVVVIGDYRGQCRKPPPNLHFLGLKPQRDLPAYLAYTDVAIIPWKVDAITRATSPLKVYEYVAMGKPVVAPDLPTLVDIPLVLRARDRSAFIACIEQARSLSISEAELEDFIARHNWTARISTLLQLLQESPTWRERTHGSHLQPDSGGRVSAR
ncbi:MAG: glycosyltransferase, partial [Acidobacteria bacterium]|nr:glycosyltransferase [Acidobacteriota bacterium]